MFLHTPRNPNRLTTALRPAELHVCRSVLCWGYGPVHVLAIVLRTPVSCPPVMDQTGSISRRHYNSLLWTQDTGWGAGIAQWLERRTRDWKVAGSNPCWNGGRIFFSRVDFLCWLLFRYPFHPRVTTVARKKSRSFCQKCRWQVTAKHAYTLRMWLLLNRASALVTTCP